MASMAQAYPHHERELSLIVSQIRNLAVVLGCAVAVGIISWLFPGFFVYQYMTWGGWDSVAAFWPLYLWGIGANLAFYLYNPAHASMSAHESRSLLVLETITSTLAGIWEELGYRWVFVCFGMICVIVTDWLFSSGIGWLATIALIVTALYLYLEKERALAILAIAAAALTLTFALYADPLLWLRKVLLYVTHLMTLGQMENVLYGKMPQAMVFGALLANMWFRDGHKYQGPIGIVNSWYAGLVFLYATVNYGLYTAIVVHALYDIAIALFRYTVQKTH